MNDRYLRCPEDWCGFEAPAAIMPTAWSQGFNQPWSEGHLIRRCPDCHKWRDAELFEESWPDGRPEAVA